MAFLRHGCAVSTVCPPGHPLRFVTGIASIHPYRGLSPTGSLQAAIREAKPTLIVPCDDATVWQLYALHASEPDLQPLIEYSLGSPHAYPAIQRRAEVLQTAKSLGIRVPFTRTLNSPEELTNWQFDTPAVLKLDGTWGGEGVSVVRSLSEATNGFHAARKAMKASVAWKRFVINRHAFALWLWKRRKASEITIQEFIPGRPATTMFACWKGEVLASTAVEVLASQGPTGAASVVKVIQNREIEEAVRLLADKFQLNGLHGLDFILEENTDAAYLLEINPRATQLGHLNLSPNGDLAGVMAAKLQNQTLPLVTAQHHARDNIVAFFPYTYKSNPNSPYLKQAYHDVPWEEPALIRELVNDDSWPERQWVSRIYHYFRSWKQPASEPKFFQQANSKLQS